MNLNFLATGNRDVEWYVKSGQLAFRSIRYALERNAVALENLKTVLDFGCGAGRVIRYWHGRHGLSAAVHGTDYNPELIHWCQRRLTFAKFQLNRLEPPLDYSDDVFDLIYALSVFTHLMSLADQVNAKMPDFTGRRQLTSSARIIR